MKVQRKLQLITIVMMLIVNIHRYLSYNVMILLVVIGFIIHVKMNMSFLSMIMNLIPCMVSRNVVKYLLIR